METKGCITWNERLNLYVDGELEGHYQPLLFAHLSECASCRRTFESLLDFRRVVQEERLRVPMQVDEAVLERLKHYRKPAEPASHLSMWKVHAPVSLRAGIAAAFLFFAIGLWSPLGREVEPSATSVSPPPPQPAMRTAEAMPNTVYVFYPGLVIEASANEGPVPGESL